MLSIIIPAYNEEDSITELADEINKVCHSFFYEIIFIDDGSTDATFSKIKELRVKNDRVKALRFRRNFGKSAALSAGFSEARGEFIITMDADLQDDPKEIPNFLSKIKEGYDLVSGWKKERKDPIIKLISSKIFNITVSYLMGITLHDFNCGFKIYRREVIENIEIYGEMHRFLPALAHQKGFRVGEMKVKHSKRKFGKSKYGAFGLRRAKNYLLDPINVFMLTKYMQKPLHFFGSIGLLLFCLGFIIDFYLSLLRIFTGSIQGHYPLLMLGILLIMVGVQIGSLGLLAEITAKTNKQKSETYTIKEKLF